MLYGSCSVSETPEVWQCVRSIRDFSSLRVELGHDPGPQQAGGPQLGHLHEQVHADGEEEREPGGERVDVEAPGGGGPDVLEAVGDGEGQLLVGRRPRLLHVVAGDGDRVEPGHVLGRVLDDVGHDPHARRRRVDVGVADHELLEDVVLDGPAELVLAHALLLGRHDVAGQHRQHGPVHGHRHADLVEGDVVEEDLHVLDRVDGHAGHAHVALHPGVVAVVAPVGGEVEGHREAGLPGGQVALVEGVGLLGGGEARRTGAGSRAGCAYIVARDAADERRRSPGSPPRCSTPDQVGLGVQRVHGDALGGLPDRARRGSCPAAPSRPGPARLRDQVRPWWPQSYGSGSCCGLVRGLGVVRSPRLGRGSSVAVSGGPAPGGGGWPRWLVFQMLWGPQ